MDAQGAAAERDEFGLPRPPISKALGEPVVVLEHVQKRASDARPLDVTLLQTTRLRGARRLFAHLRTFLSHQILSSTPFAGTDEFTVRKSDLYSGEFVMLRGPSGGGKTSLLNILGTIDRASGGRVGAVADEH